MKLEDIVGLLINPLIYVLAGLILLLVIRKHRSKLILLLTLYFYLVSVTYSSHFFSRLWRVNDSFMSDVRYDAVVVLAGVSDVHWLISCKDLFYIPDNVFAVGETSDRIFAGIYFVKSGHAKRLLIGEWHYDAYDEAKGVRKLAVEMGLNENQMIFYGRTKTTADEINGVRDYVRAHALKKILLVTSESHMRRALEICKRGGLNPDVFSVNKEPDQITWEAFIPDAKGIRKTERCMYELIGYAAFFVKNSLWQEPFTALHFE